MPLAPSATLLARFPDHLARALAVHDIPESFVSDELSRMDDVRLAKTASRGLLGIMNEFTFLAQADRGRSADTDLTALARWLASTPYSPLFKRHGSPASSRRDRPAVAHRPSGHVQSSLPTTWRDESHLPQASLIRPDSLTANHRSPQGHSRRERRR